MSPSTLLAPRSDRMVVFTFHTPPLAEMLPRSTAVTAVKDPDTSTEPETTNGASNSRARVVRVL